MKVLSLFDGISCARVALERAGIPVDFYYTSEIDKYANEISYKNYPDIIRLGNVISVTSESVFDTIDLLIGGSPCQDLSIAKKNRKGLKGERSGLFWEYVRILREVKPKWFILENVASMPKEDKQIITDTLGVKPIMINASLVSAQNRKRLFWTNIPNVTQPMDRGIMLKDILEKNVDAKYYLSQETIESIKGWNNAQAGRIRGVDSKSVSLQANGGGTGAKTGLYKIDLPTNTKKGFTTAIEREDGINLSFPNSKTRRGRVIKGKSPTLQTTHTIGVLDGYAIRKLTPLECERLQGLPDGWTEGVSNTQRYKALGNAFNVDVVAHILSFIPN